MNLLDQLIQPRKGVVKAIGAFPLGLTCPVNFGPIDLLISRWSPVTWCRVRFVLDNLALKPLAVNGLVKLTEQCRMG